MPEREPALLRDGPVDAPRAAEDPPGDSTEPMRVPPVHEPSPPPPRRDSKRPVSLPDDRAVTVRDDGAVYVVGFWKRLLAALIDLAIIIPVGLLLTLIAGKIAGVRPPAGLDIWLLLLDNEPALAMGLGLTVAVGAVYALVFQIVRGRTIGMRVLKIRIIDVYGERPSPARCVLRTLGYLLGLVTLFLGFIWIGFDGEKRGLHDWIAGTYVIQG